MKETKDKKKTLTISKDFTKKVDPSNILQQGKKSFSIEKKKPFKPLREGKKTIQNDGGAGRFNPNKKKNFAGKRGIKK